MAKSVDTEAAPAPDQAALTRLDRLLLLRPGRKRTLAVVLPLFFMLGCAAAYGSQLLLADVGQAGSQNALVTCWDRSTEDGPASCSRPVGEAGLRWVFPSFRPDRGTCFDELARHPEYNRPTMWTCTYSLGGRKVQITYSELTSVASGRTYFKKEYAGGERAPASSGVVKRYLWRSPATAVDGSRSLAWMYGDFPYAFTIQAPTLGVCERALRQLIEFQGTDSIKIRPS